MKSKKFIIICVIAIVTLIILFVPFVVHDYDDGGTKTYGSLTYKIVVWNVIIHPEGEDYQIYHKTNVYWFPNNLKSLDELWKIENLECDFVGITQ